MNLIETNALCKCYGRTVCVQNLNLRLPEGAIYGFLGPNGAGKSTTLKMILGLARPTSGSVTVFGQPLSPKNRMTLLRDIGALIESPAYYGHLTAAENLEIIRQLRGLPKESIQEALSIVRLEHQTGKRVSQFSLGMKQRLGIAEALLSRPKLLILDEPTNGLDPAGIQEMRELIRTLPARYGMTVLVSSHLLSEIDQLATEIGVIAAGRLVFQDSLEVLHARGEHRLALRTTDNRRAGEVLRRLGISAEEGEAFVLLPPLEDGAAAAMTRALQAQDIGILRLEERQKTLEDIFLELTGEAVSL